MDCPAEVGADVTNCCFWAFLYFTGPFQIVVLAMPDVYVMAVIDSSTNAVFGGEPQG